MKYNYVIIEDHKGAYENLKAAMKGRLRFQLKGNATNKNDGLMLIMQKQPDLIFLDVELGEENGFDLVNELKNAYFQLPPIIMTTAHDNYAKDAVNNQITYFLSKPICPIELTKSLRVFEKKYANCQSQLFIRNGKGLEVVKYDDIIYLQADEGYTTILLDCGKKISVAKSLKHFESKLNNDFMRVHRSYLVNINHIKEVKLTDRQMILESSNQCSQVEIGKNQILKIRTQLKI